MPDAAAVRAARDLLGVSAEASASELSHVYRRQARLLHPDLSTHPRATERFRSLHAAYHLALRAVPAGATRPEVGPSMPRQPVQAPSFRGRSSSPGDLLGAWPPAPVDALWVQPRPRTEPWLVAGPVRIQPA